MQTTVVVVEAQSLTTPSGTQSLVCPNVVDGSASMVKMTAAMEILIIVIIFIIFFLFVAVVNNNDGHFLHHHYHQNSFQDLPRCARSTTSHQHIATRRLRAHKSHLHSIAMADALVQTA